MSEDATVPAAANEAATESEWRQSELDQRDRHHRSQLISVYVAAFLTLAGLVVTAVGIVWTLDGQQQEQRDAAEQFQQTLEKQEDQRREDARRFQLSLQREEYPQIVEGLSRASAAVQDSSMRRLAT